MTMRAGQRGQQITDFLAAVQLDDGHDLGAATGAVLRTRERDAIAIVSGDVDADALSAVTSMSRRFASAALVTIRPVHRDAVRWMGGLHLTGRDADAALSRWNSGVGPLAAPGPSGRRAS